MFPALVGMWQIGQCTERGEKVLFFKINFYWRRVALKCCVGFYSTNTNESATYTHVCVYTSPLSWTSSRSGDHRALSRVPRALYHVEKWFYVALPCCLPWSSSTSLSFHTPPCPGTQRRRQAPTGTRASWELKGRKSFRWMDGAGS